MVAQSEVEKLREELSRVRTEGTSNLFGENVIDIKSMFVGCRHLINFVGSYNSALL